MKELDVLSEGKRKMSNMPQMWLSHRSQKVEKTIVSVVGDMVRATPGAISLGQGVVYYGPPAEAIDEVRNFLEKSDNHKYTPVTGIPLLIEAVKAKLYRENGINEDSGGRIVITAGANMGFVNAVMSIADPGDEIIVPVPYYFNHIRAIAMAGCRYVLVPTDGSYQLIPEAIRLAITDRTKAVVTVSPNNPSGAVYSESALREVNKICHNYGLYHISDEAYEYFTYGHAKHFSPGSILNSGSYTISLYSLSKAYGFASWRIGYMVVPEHLFSTVEKIQDILVICPPGISQFAALGALRAGADYCRRMIKELACVREVILSELSDIKNICTVRQTEGAFYFLLSVHSKLDPMELVQRLIREYGVGIIPGTSFGLKNDCFVRVSYGCLKKEMVTEAIGRLVTGLRKLVRS